MSKKSELLFGFHSVVEAVRAGRRNIDQIFLSNKQSSKRSAQIERLARDGKIRLKKVDPQYLDQTTRFARHQGVAAEAAPLVPGRAADAENRIRNNDSPCFFLVVESIEDPQNLGALIRTALCAGVDGILIPKDRCTAPSPAVSRSSAGAMEHADIMMITNTASTLKSLKAAGAWVFGLDSEGDKVLYDADFSGHIVLVIGGEHKGIRPLVKKECDFLVSIPNLGRINSLNASVAGGIAMFEALRQRR